MNCVFEKNNGITVDPIDGESSESEANGSGVDELLDESSIPKQPTAKPHPSTLRPGDDDFHFSGSNEDADVAEITSAESDSARGAQADFHSDEEGRVPGINKLRVVDASIIPSIPAGNLNAVTIMLAEKIADSILGLSPLAPEYPAVARC